ncbi:F-box domain, Leucine-rich repeat domain, L domain-like protein [Artemisia annua]|uniref:F-box domain, Leucine-rich repeat domain, L domain-like protein n=1 Tax=Artemisia annua TaxID=35608 RepID=A0A2U1P1D5_ARTAN|nr:F-box domain, Leucine-rich repeat domain, L domain-like protein [Artemisia annua]
MDTLSNLPEDVLSNILSLMPTKYAVRTSILSKRWRYNWTLVTNIDIDCCNPFHGVENCCSFVDHVLKNCKTSEIRLFRLRFGGLWVQRSRMTKWIDEAVRLKVRELEVISGLPELPISFFTCKTITKLHIENHSCSKIMEWQTPFNLPSLKTLNMFVYRSPSLNAFKLIRGCPILESLSLAVSWQTWFLRLEQKAKPENYEESEESHWIDPKSVPTCMLMNLKTMKFEKCMARKDDIQFLEYMLRNAKVLKTLTIMCESGVMEEEFRLCAKLLNCSKASKYYTTNCLIFKYISNFLSTQRALMLQLALNSTALEKLHVTNTDISNAEDLTLLAKNCCNSLISLKIGSCYLSKLEDAFRYAVRLEHFGGGYIWDEEEKLSQFGSYIPRLSVERGECKLLVSFARNCANLTIVGLQLGGLIALAKGCTNLECLEKDGTTDLQLDNGIPAMLMGCSKFERLDITLWHGGLTDVGLEYIGKYGANLRSLSLTRKGNSDADL